MLKRLAKFIFRITGWTIEGQAPAVDKLVVIGAFHTSNWDAFWLLTCKFALDINVRYFAKHTLFWWPLGNVLRATGAMPIDRSHAASLVQQMVAAFDSNEKMWLGMAPEGTRGYRPYWKTGFYRIAKEARVPILVCSIDYREKLIRLGPLMVPDDQQTDLQTLRDFYRNATPRRPSQQGPIAFPPE